MNDRDSDVAVIGMSCRFPGARDTREYWENLRGGVESIRFFSDEEMLAAGYSPELLRDPAFVPAFAALADAYCFDAAFFGMSRREAEVADPQHRVFMECAWTALESAGCDPSRFPGAIGLYAGSGFSTHFERVLRDPGIMAAIPSKLVILGNDKDFLTTRVSYKLGLRGPSVAVQTACSSSLVAIHIACQSLLSHECEVALAGGSTIAPDEVEGYLYQEGGIDSPDGHCRAFDARSAGTVGGSGAGVVVLKRMVDALRDGDTIHAVILGSAVNNDGSAKIGFTSPSVEGQAVVVAEALGVAGVQPEEISFIETHGTGTHLGDPIEIAALKEVFQGVPEGSCALGAVKTNLGHLDTAAGVAGFIKAVLSLEHGMLPPTLHFQVPNPETGLDGSPFFVNAALREWRRNGVPRRAGVSSLGMGGTNAHVVLEEAPQLPATPPSGEPELLVLSARTGTALERMRENLAGYLAEHPEVSLAGVAHTLQEGRAAHRHRWAAVAGDPAGAREALGGAPARRPVQRHAPDRVPPVAFLFPGQGTQYAGMARELYAREPVLRHELDHCAEVLAPELGLDLRTVLFPAEGGEDEANARLRETRLAQPALFAVEYALARQWMAWGVRPEAMLGHSIGEYVAATLAGVFSLAGALRLVAARGRLMQALPAGAMLSVPLAQADVAPLLAGGLSLAAVNSGTSCVLSGDAREVDRVESVLAGQGVAARRLHTSHAFHSAAMEPILDAFAAEVARARPAPPSLPFLSNVTGDWITPAQAVDARYWVRHLRETVRFADGAARLLQDPGRVLLEVGPGDALGTFVRRNPGIGAARVVVRSLPRAGQDEAGDHAVLQAAGALWTAGVELDWAAVRGERPRRKLPLPTYPFERQEYRACPAGPHPGTAAAPASAFAAPEPRAPRAVRSDPSSLPEPMGPPVITQATPVPDRLSRITGRVADLVAQLLGTTPAALDPDAAFLEFGLDSLLLMQLSRTVERSFGVRIPFRRLLDGLESIGHLAAHLEREVPPEADPEPDPAVPAQPAAAGSNGGQPIAAHANGSGAHAPVATEGVAPAATLPATDPSWLQQLFSEQLAVIRTQLELVRDTRAGAPVAPAGSSSPALGLEANGAARSTTAPASMPAARGGGSAPVLSTVAPAPGGPASHGPHRPVRHTLRLGGAFDERQRRHFEALVERYTARTRGSREYAAHNRPRLADNRASLNFRLATKELLYPIVGERSQGSRLWDVDGNEYIDFTIGFGVHFFGHRPQFIMEAVEEQLRRGCHTGPQSDLAGPVAALFSELTGMERVTFCNTGSEAVMTALRIARTVTGRDRIVLFQGSYHGCFDGILARRDPAGAGAPRSCPAAPGTPQGMVDDVVVLPYGTPETLEYLRAHAGELAAVLVEPLRTPDPELQPREFLHEVRALTERAGTVLIFDEMITGLRLQWRGAMGWYGVEADLATYGKVIGGGFPLGVVAGRAALMDAVDGGQWSYGDDSYPLADQTFFAGTFCKHPVTMAAARAVLLHLRERGQPLYDELHARTARVVAGLRAVIDEEQVPIRIRHEASFFRFAFRPEDPYIDLLFYHMLERGIYVWEERACFLSTAHTDEDCDALVRAFRESVLALREGGFLPPTTGGGGDAGAAAVPGGPATAPAQGPRTVPLTPAQREVWAHAQLGDDASRAYNEQFTVAVAGRLDLDALRASVDDLVRHHDALRTVFDPSGEVQHIAPALGGPLPVAVHPPVEGGELEQALDGAVREVFDLAAGPLFRIHVHERAPGRHVLQFVVHHLVADALSTRILEQDLEAAYRARRQGRAPALAPAMQMGEYAALLAAELEREAGREAEWLAGFQGAGPLALPADRSRPRFPTHRAGSAARVLPAPLVARLREAGRARGCTLFMTLLGGVAATLHRMAATDDLVIGIPSANRSFDGAETLVGHCVDILPVRSRAGAETPFPAFLLQVRGWLLDAYENELFTAARLHQTLRVPRGPGLPPLISVVFNLEPGASRAEAGEAPRFGDLPLEPLAGAAAPFAKFDLQVDAVEIGDEVELAATFAADLFDEGAVQRLLGAVERVLEQAAAEAPVRIADLELMGPVERERVVVEWNRTAAELPAGQCIHHAFEAQAARAPDAVALVFEGGSLTRRMLDERANGLAHHLRARGVGPEARVGVLMERGPEMVVALLAILKAGGAYLPLDPEHPAERLGWMLDDSGVVRVLAQRALVDRLPARTRVEVLAVDEADIPGRADPLEGGAHPESLAYVIYTSGSTGRPKGVMNAHRGVVNRLAWMQAELGLADDDVVLQKTPFGFDVSVWELFWPLREGARLVMARPEGHRDPEYLQETIEREGVTTIHFVPSMLREFVEAADPARCATLARVVCSGEALAPELVRRFHERFPASAELFNLYGPTEAAVDVSCWTCARGAPADGVPIGRPVWNTALYVLDAALRPLPVGVPGELYIGGVQVARGYLDRPRLTAERFVPDPFSAAAGARLYRTGDRARWRPDGAVEYLGRLDHQVKVRGIRIEPGEVEAALRACAGVADCAVVARHDASGELRLAAFIVGEADPEALRVELRRTLPEHLVPDAFVHLPALPLGSTGKLDRSALPAPAFSSADGRHVAPRTQVEEVLAGIWAGVLGVERVGARDSFFDLGGHSLLATRVVSRVRAAFGVELTLRTLFERPTLAALAARVEELRRTGMPAPPVLVPGERPAKLPLSFAQERLWFLDRLEGASLSYDMSSALRIPGPLDLGALERALGEIVRRHEALRTTFHELDGAPVQRVAPFAGFSLAVADRPATAGAEREAEVRRWLRVEAARPFDLAAGPLFEPRVLRVADDDHVILLRMHHIVSDRWSMGVLFADLAAAYDACRGGRAPALPALPMQYADFALWQRGPEWTEVLDEQAAWWRRQLAGMPTLQELPADHPRRAVRSHRGAAEGFELPAPLADGLRALARREGATLYMVLLAAFQVLLSRYGGSDDVVVGSPVAGRTRGEVEELVGFFVNTLVLRTDLSGDPGFREVLRRVREVTLGAYERQDVPFERLVAELQPARSLSHSPLFQVMFSLHQDDAPEGALPWPGAREVYAENGGTTKFDLSLELTAGDRVTGSLEYSTDLFERDTAVRMLGHLTRILRQVDDDPGVRLSALELLDEEERSRVLLQWNAAAADRAPATCVHHRFEAQARRTPQAVAVRAGAEALSYAALDARANRLAHHLARLGVGPDARVALCMERGIDLVVSVLGVLKAGGAYVPVDPDGPAERLARVLADTGATVLLARGEVAPPPVGVEVVRLDAAWGESADEAGGPPAVEVMPENLAYVIHTSGSTGTPKGVGATHGGVSNYLAWFDRVVLDEEGFALPMVSRLSFDAHVRQLFPPLLRGEAAWVLPETVAADPRAILQALAAHEGRVSFGGVPSLWAAMVELVRAGEAPRPEGLVAVLLGGDTLAPDLVERTFALFPDVALWNHYGPTETTVNVSVARVRPAGPVEGADARRVSPGGAAAGSASDPVRQPPADGDVLPVEQVRTVDARWSGGRVPIGAPISNTRVYVLDGAMRPVPVGVPGELYAGGAGVARGYVGRPGLTAERFVADPFGDGGRLYRTGDRVRWRSDGTLELLGRLDHQVKVRGFRVEPGEIEARLVEHPGVYEAVVLAREDARGEKRLVAWYVGGEPAGAHALRAHLSARLPDYMVPAAFVRLDALPLSSNGKVDRAALPAPHADAYAARAWAPPLGETEAALAEIWADVLGLERVGRWDHFFELGGHSLRAVQAVSRVRQVLGVEAELGELFLHPVLADFARGVETGTRSELPPIVPVPRDGRLELSFAQRRLWFVERMGGAGGAYNIPLRLRMAGELNQGALARALDRIVERHEALRTVYVLDGGEPVQRILPAEASRVRLVEHDLSSHPARRDELARLMRDEAAAPFDLERGPVIRGRLVRLDVDRHVLLVTVHHIASDGWSSGVLVNELGALYRAFLADEPDPLPPLPVQYADYAAWQRRWLDDRVVPREAEYWTAVLAGAPERLELPADRPRPAQQDFTGGFAPLALDEALTAGLKALGRRHGTTLFMTLLAGWAAVLGRLAGQDDVVVGTPTANRGRREIEGLIGFFVNTLALRVELGGAPTVAELLGRVRTRALDAQQHQDLPFERVVELVRPARSLAHTPLFQVVLAWHNAPAGALELPGLELGDVEGEEYTPAKYDLSLGLEEVRGRIEGGAWYAAALFDHASVMRWLGYLRVVLAAMAADDRVRLDALPLLSDDERRRVVEACNRTDRAYPREACLHDLFARHAAERPDAVAVEWDELRLSYAEVDARANRLAHHLARHGVGPESRVGVLLERGAELVVSILAVLKAGGCYVPLDPTYPAERLRLMLADAGVRVLVTRGGLASPVHGDGVEAVDLEQAAGAIAAEPAEAPASGATAQNLAYVVYTSGSTGRPKGVMVSHQTVVQLVVETDYVRFAPGDRIAQASNASFDALAFEVWGAFSNGATLVGVPRDVLLSAPAMAAFLRDREITTLYQTTALLNQLARERPELFAPLREVLFGGQQVDADAVRRVLRAGGPRRLLHMYGPTETTAWCSCEEVEAVPDGATTVPVGRPTGNQRIYLLDRALHPVPIGIPGEAYVGGGGVVRGYLDRPGLTAERFVPDPFAAEPGARMYRTGDRLRRGGDGTLEFVGRLDDQVKIRGFRIEPGEVESALGAHPRVDEARVVVREDSPGEQRLVAYVVGGADASELRGFLGATLPEYMVPAAFVALDRLPLTPSGKLDRDALPAPEYGGGREHRAPATPVEQALAAIWSGVLGVETVGLADDFFALGGHSLLIMRLATQVRSAFGVELPIRSVFAAPTLGAMAAGIEGDIYEEILAMTDAQAEQLAGGTQAAGGPR